MDEKGVCCQPRRPEFGPQNPHSGRKNQLLKVVFCLMVLEGEKSGTKELSLVRTHNKKADGSTAGGNGVGGWGRHTI